MNIDAAAKELHEARLDRSTVPTLTSRWSGMSRGDAYAVQAAGLAQRQAGGEFVVGGKLGFTSLAMQRAMGVDSPNYGWLTDAMFVHDRIISLSELIHPKVEPEIAFLLYDDLGHETDAQVVVEASVTVMPCLEVVDSRFDGFRFQALDNIADNSSSGQVVLGSSSTVPSTIDLRTVGVVVSVDGTPVMTASGAAALNDPAAAVAWMAREVADSGRPLRAGDVVISGGLTAPIDLQAGMSVRVDIDRIGSAAFRVEE